MKKTSLSPLLSLVLLLSFTLGCRQAPQTPDKESAEAAMGLQEETLESRTLSSEFNTYWFAGLAEVSSYDLEQARYGEMRNGEAVLIFVTEPFNPDKQVKADRKSPSTTTVMKLNRVRKFLTGVYPYSIMSSIFYPVFQKSHALKITTSVQEWCGHVFAQLNNRERFQVQSNSYFETEADQSFSLEKNILEDELWTMLRIDPGEIPTGNLHIVPSLEYLRLKHQPIRAYEASLSFSAAPDAGELILVYPELDRTLTIQFGKEFPHRIQGWTETYPSGRGEMTSRATLRNTILSPYWQKNGNSDVSLRDSLGLNTP